MVETPRRHGRLRRRRRRPAAVRLVLVLAGLILLGWGLGVLAVHVARGPVHTGLDHPVNRWVRAHHHHAVARVLGHVSDLGAEPVVVPLAVVAGALWSARRRDAGALWTLGLAAGGGFAVALAVKVAVRKGQASAPGGLGGIGHLAFPSGHATLAAAVYGAISLLLLRPPARWWRRAGAIAFVALAVTIGIARVYNGQHDPTDVIGGWLLGGLWAWVVTMTAGGLTASGTAVTTRRMRPRQDSNLRHTV